MRKIICLFLLMLLSGCASTVTFPDGKEITFKRGFRMRDFEAKYEDKNAKKEYEVKGNGNIKLPNVSLISLPAFGTK